MHEEWEKRKIPAAYKKLSSGKDGISDDDAYKRLLKHGKNEIRKTHKVSPVKIFLSQFTSPLIIILIAAAMLSFGAGFLPGSEPEIVDSVLIMIIVVAVGVSGFFQDWRAEMAIEALKKMSTPTAVVIRNGKEIEISTSDIVPGDVVVVGAGDIIPADGKIIQSFDMVLDESILTGESKSIRKGSGNIAFMNTSLITGRGKILVFATGMKTMVGTLAEKMEKISDTKTPFQKELDKFSKKIFWMIASIALLMLVVGYFKYGLYSAFLTSISLAVAAIPEGLPAVVTLALALGAKSMAGSNALVRKLPVVESVGSVNVICTDKTGTLTKNKMSVTRVFFNDAVYDRMEMNPDDVRKMDKLMLCGSLCNDSKAMFNDKGEKVMTGDQTEVSIAEFAISKRFEYENARETYKRIGEIPFTSKRKMMSVLCSHGGKNYVFSKGAPEVLLKRCTKVLYGGKVKKLDNEEREKIMRQNSEFATHALRVLAFAYKETRSSAADEKMEKDLVFIGLEGMLDPPRDDVREALDECKTAGIRVVMVTGDNIETAKAIANEIGLESKTAVSGDSLEHMTDERLSSMLDDGVNIFARVSPFDKLRILKVLQMHNRVIMTGDGVNDALALKKSDVGIAMGGRGTEVAKEASDMILMDDNFATIRNSVREGRRIFDNIRKFVNYQLTCHLAEVVVIFMATLFFALDEPILIPIQILWINLLTDGMPAIALGLDPALPGIMRRQPRSMKEGIFNRNTMYSIVLMGGILSALLFTAYILISPLGVETARSALFMGFVLYEFIKMAEIRHSEELSFFDNKFLLVALVSSIALQMAVVYTPLNVYFSVVPLGVYEWLVLISLAVVGWFSSIGMSRLLNKYVK